jgi:hypothetical protein
MPCNASSRVRQPNPARSGGKSLVRVTRRSRECGRWPGSWRRVKGMAAKAIIAAAMHKPARMDGEIRIRETCGKRLEPGLRGRQDQALTEPSITRFHATMKKSAAVNVPVTPMRVANCTADVAPVPSAS